ncbi:MAG: fused isobutyryl-CoA mutase/GTPase IcmF [Nannocystaceae bacterium]
MSTPVLASSTGAPASPAAAQQGSTTPHYRPENKIRVVTATALFDGHDAAINVMRRILQAHGAEVIHLGHHRGAEEVVDAAIEEDAQAIAVSTYQGGHMEYFRYLYDLLREKGAPHITIWGGGGGVIVPREIEMLHAYGIKRVFSPEDGRSMGLDGMIDVILRGSDFSTSPDDPVAELGRLRAADMADCGVVSRLARLISVVERGGEGGELLVQALRVPAEPHVPVIGVTGTGGAGKSSLTDELVARFMRESEPKRVAILSIDPTRRRTGGALLGDRIRMNALVAGPVYMRSLATRGSGGALSRATGDAVRLCKCSGFELIIIESSGIGQADAGIEEVADLTTYVMTSEYGAQTQLEKIEMLDVADLVVINKYERSGAKDALRDVRRQFRRNQGIAATTPDEALPVFGTVASRFHDSGVNAYYAEICRRLTARTGSTWRCGIPECQRALASETRGMIPSDRAHYLAEIAHTLRAYKRRVARQVEAVRQRDALRRTLDLAKREDEHVASWIGRRLDAARGEVDPDAERALVEYEAIKRAYAGATHVVKVRERSFSYDTSHRTLSGLRVPRVCLPGDAEPGAIVRYMMLEGPPGHFPYTGGVFEFKREGEDPKRMFAGEGGPRRTNERFHYLAGAEAAKRLSTAFDSVTLYGQDPGTRPDIYGKVGESGVSVCTLEDMSELFAGFDLCSSTTSVSMTINGPAPILLAFYMNAACDQRVAELEVESGNTLGETERSKVLDHVLQTVRGTVQADILKEDQGQNTCIFSIEFAMRMMADVQAYFIEKGVRNYYSVSISGYHIAEAGANPISQLAFTLGNGFTYVEYYLSRGLEIDAFAPNLSFFFSNGLDAEYTVIGRVARRIWAVAMRDLYDANGRSQKLKYHIQTSGRSLHAMEIDFNDVRTTLQALFAYYDHCNSLHTNAYDEAITTPTEESVRRAMAIQLIITKEQGLAKTENVLQGSYIVEELTELVEEAVLDEFLRLDERGGVLGAMERQYQRGKIQDESMTYERLKHSGELPIVGVNTFRNPARSGDQEASEVLLTRASSEEKDDQIRRLLAFQDAHSQEAPAALARLKKVALEGGNVFEELISTTRCCSLGQVSRALFEVGGEYRRNM